MEEKNLAKFKDLKIETELTMASTKKFEGQKGELKSIKTDRQINELTQKLEESQFKNLFLLAEMENLKKRLANEKVEYQKYSNISLLQELIPVLDMFKRALQAHNVSEEIKKWLIGFKMINTSLDNILMNSGVKKINLQKGELFNPKYHEALESKPSKDFPENHIIEIKQTGYLLNNRLIRPSVVIVSSGTNDTKNITKN